MASTKPPRLNLDLSYFQADIFSLGVTFYELVTQGKKPFGDSPYQCDLDAAAISKRTIKPLPSVGCPHWPDMQNIIFDCLQSQPGESLTTNVVHHMISVKMAAMNYVPRCIVFFTSFTPLATLFVIVLFKVD